MKKSISIRGGRWLFPVYMFFCSAGCATIARFDQHAYTQATSLKVDALQVMNAAVEQYTIHEAEVVSVQTAIDKIYEYERSRPKNEISQKMWAVLKDANGHLFGGFVKRWQQEGKLDAVFIKEAQMLISQSFDQIAQLESGKIKAQQLSN